MTTPPIPPPEDRVPTMQQPHPVTLSSPIVWTGKGKAPVCAACNRPMRASPEYPNQGTGCIVALLGLLFAPCLIGIPIAIWGLVMMNGKRDRWVCLGCGRDVKP